jgi:L-arabinose isomerase
LQIFFYYGSYSFYVIAEGESAKGLIPLRGNRNTRGLFSPDVRNFLKRWISEGPTHHFALGIIGHHAAMLEELAKYLGVER